MKPLLFTLFLFISRLLFAPATNTLVLIDSEPTGIYEAIITAVIQVESGGDSLALNTSEQSCGLFQIRPIRIADYNNRTGSHYMTWDAFDPEISEKIFRFYASQIGPYNTETLIKSWNGKGEMAERYLLKVKDQINKNLTYGTN